MILRGDLVTWRRGGVAAWRRAQRVASAATDVVNEV